MDDDFLDTYFTQLKTALEPDGFVGELVRVKNLIVDVNKNGGRLIFAGNGAAAAISSHVALDFTKQAKINALTFHDPAWITALANDFGYDLWLSKSIEKYCSSKDLVVLISVSGESENVLRAATTCQDRKIRLITFTGKSETNSLRGMGDINLWVDSHAYNIVENVHMAWITSVIDLIIGKLVYDVT